MAEHNLDDLVPEDIGVTYQGVRYVIPGDLDVDTTAALFQMFYEAVKLEAGGGKVQTAQVRRAADRMRRTLLDLFRIRQPEMESLPFGVVGTSHVIRIILTELGILVTRPDGDGQIGEETPTVPPRAKPGARGKKPRSSTRSRR